MKAKMFIGFAFMVLVTFMVLQIKSESMSSKEFVGINGKSVVVRGNFDDKQKNSSQNIPQIGDIIKNEKGEDEVVFAINEDGSFITVPPDVYNQVEDGEIHQ